MTQQTSEQSSIHKQAASSERHQDNNSPPAMSHQATETFSIATPILTNTLSLNENLNDTTFLRPTVSSYDLYPHNQEHSLGSTSASIIIDHDTQIKRESAAAKQTTTATESSDQQQAQTGGASQSTVETKNIDKTNEQRSQSQASLTVDTSPNDESLNDGSPKKKKTKTSVKKSAKLDTKSKLEKSRQSARECRARKKLRYQYLEDLVCNREKAVIKLREELSMFCEMSKKIEGGNVNEIERHSLIEQTKENSKS